MLAAAGTEVVREGDESRDGQRVADLGPGDYFGEIALLREVPRTATCTATTGAELYTIGRERFVSAVTGNKTTAREVESVIHARLTELQAPA
jgi:CRP-like cAMP-binding protein